MIQDWTAMRWDVSMWRPVNKTHQSARAHRVLMNPFLDHLHCRTERLNLTWQQQNFTSVGIHRKGIRRLKCQMLYSQVAVSITKEQDFSLKCSNATLKYFIKFRYKSTHTSEYMCYKSIFRHNLEVPFHHPSVKVCLLFALQILQSLTTIWTPTISKIK